MPNMVAMLKGGPHPGPAKQLIDPLLSAEVEEKLAVSPVAQMPLGPGVKTSEWVRTPGSLKGMEVDYRKIAETLEQIQPFLSTWVGYR
jgi:iron(III) transport system substrate-binding protein